MLFTCPGRLAGVINSRCSGEISRFFSHLFYVGAGDHSCVSFEYLTEILGIVAQPHLLCDCLDLIQTPGCQKLFGFFDADVGQIVGESDSCFLQEFFAHIVHIHKEIIF